MEGRQDAKGGASLDQRGGLLVRTILGLINGPAQGSGSCPIGPKREVRGRFLANRLSGEAFVDPSPFGVSFSGAPAPTVSISRVSPIGGGRFRKRDGP